MSQTQPNDQNCNGLKTTREQSPGTKLTSHRGQNSKPASKSTKPTGMSNVSSSDVHRNLPQRTPKSSSTLPKWPTPASVSQKTAKAKTGLLSVVEEQQQSGKLTVPINWQHFNTRNCDGGSTSFHFYVLHFHWCPTKEVFCHFTFLSFTSVCAKALRLGLLEWGKKPVSPILE